VRVLHGRGRVGIDDLTLVAAAARNNADWCDAYCQSQGVAGRFTADCWSSPRRTPPLYPDAVMLAPGVAVEAVLSRIDTGAGCSVKDSFDDLDLDSAGFRPLFRAAWIARTDAPEPRSDWSASPLAGMENRVAAMAGPAGRAVATRSAGVIGLSNVAGDLEAAFAGAAALARAHWGPLPVVGYESGAALEAAHEAGFRSIGELTVWIR
jgi:hypothetical protein